MISDLITASRSDMMGCVSYLNLLLSLLSLKSVHQGKKWCFFSIDRRGLKFISCLDSCPRLRSGEGFSLLLDWPGFYRSLV